MFANRLSKLALLGGLTTALAGCGEDRQRSEAKAFLALYESIDHRAPAAVREAKLKKLGELTLSDDTVAKAREECTAAHRTLLTAERQHEQSAQKLDSALANNQGGAPLPPAVTAEIQSGIDDADRALADARGRFERCEEQSRSLSLRFGKN